MAIKKITDVLAESPIIAATDRNGWGFALHSDAAILFHLNANITTVSEDIKSAKAEKKLVFVHIDLADGIGKDRAGIEWLYNCGVDGIISTRSALIKITKEFGLVSVQRFFALDTKGMNSIGETIENTKPDLIEIMPGVIPKAIKLFSDQKIPVIAGGLVETKSEVMSALSSGASAVSTGKKELWSL